MPSITHATRVQTVRTQKWKSRSSGVSKSQLGDPRLLRGESESFIPQPFPQPMTTRKKRTHVDDSSTSMLRHAPNLPHYFSAIPSSATGGRIWIGKLRAIGRAVGQDGAPEAQRIFGEGFNNRHTRRVRRTCHHHRRRHHQPRRGIRRSPNDGARLAIADVL